MVARVDSPRLAESSFFLDAVMRSSRIDDLVPITDMEKFQDLLAFLLLQGGAGVIFRRCFVGGDEGRPLFAMMTGQYGVRFVSR